MSMGPSASYDYRRAAAMCQLFCDDLLLLRLPTIAGVEILVRDMEKARRLLGDIDLLAGAVDADHRLHGLSLRLRSA
jgi:hypothetical protein